MWTCPICQESGDSFDPEGHRHYLLHYLPPNDNGDWEYCGDLVEKAGIPLFLDTFFELVSFKERCSRSEALGSLGGLLLRARTFPVPLRDLIRTVLENQIESLGDEAEGVDCCTVVMNLQEYLDNVLNRSAVDLRINVLINPDDPHNVWGIPGWVYWAEDPSSAALDCSARLAEDVKQLKRLRIEGARFKVVG